MFTIMPRSKGNCIALNVNGKAREEDYEALEPIFEAKAKEHGKINLMLVMENFEGYADFDAVKEDIESTFDAYKSLERLAIVGTSTIQKASVAFFGIFTKTKEKYFDMDELEQAWAWTCGE